MLMLYRPVRQQGADRLLVDQGRHPRLHQGAGQPAAAAWHPGQRRGTGPGVDPAKPGRQAGAGRGRVRQEQRHGSCRAAGRAVAGVRVPGLAGDGAQPLEICFDLFYPCVVFHDFILSHLYRLSYKQFFHSSVTIYTKMGKEYVVATTFYILFVVLYSFRKVCLTFYAKYTILFLQSKLCKKIVSAHL